MIDFDRLTFSFVAWSVILLMAGIMAYGPRGNNIWHHGLLIAATGSLLAGTITWVLT